MLVTAGIGLFAANQTVGIALPIHIVQQLDGTAGDVGTVAGMGTVGALVGRLAAGRIADRVGTRRGYLVAAGMLAAACLAYPLLPALLPLAIARTVHLAAFAVATSLYAMAATQSGHADERGQRLGMAHIAMHIALLASPVLAINVLGNELRAIGPLAAVLVVLSAALAARSIPTAPAAAAVPVPPIPAAETEDPTQSSRAGAGAAGIGALAAVLVGASDGVAMEFVPLVGAGRDIAGYGAFYLAFALAAMAVLTRIGWILRRATGRQLTAGAFVVLAAGYATLAVAGSWPALAVGGVLVGSGFGGGQTAVGLRFVDGHSRGTTGLARFFLWVDIGRAGGVYTTGQVADHLGLAFPFGMLGALLLAGGAVVLLEAMRATNRPQQRSAD